MQNKQTQKLQILETNTHCEHCGLLVRAVDFYHIYLSKHNALFGAFHHGTVS